MSSTVEDRVIGLQVGDAKFYTRTTTLLAAGDSTSYFHELLIENPYNILHKEDKGTTKLLPIYFVNRDGALFEHVLEFLRSIHHETEFLLPSTFQQDPTLWRNLRQEALFFGLPELTQRLYVTHTCHYSPDHRGVLYWLGTKYYGTSGSPDYENPFATGRIALGRYSKHDSIQDKHWTSLKTLVGTNAVQYRMPTYGYRWNSKEPHIALHPLACNVKWWYSGGKKPLVMDLKDVRVRPTHVSLRSFFQFRGTWSWQGRQDPNDYQRTSTTSSNSNSKSSRSSKQSQPPWETLITLDGTKHTLEITNHMLQTAVLQVIHQDIRGRSGMTPERRDQVLVDTAENLMRQTWKIERDNNSNKKDDGEIAFYRYFRFVKEEPTTTTAASFDDGESTLPGNESDEIVHNGVGIELFGDVHQE